MNMTISSSPKITDKPIGSKNHDKDKKEKIVVTIKKQFFYNDESGFGIFKVSGKTENIKKNTFSIKGNIGSHQKGTRLIVEGTWEKHPQFGDQLKVTSFDFPEVTDDDILLFLKEGNVKGVGKTLAENIINHFGKETARILDTGDERLLEVPKIGRKKFQTIIKSWAKKTQNKEYIIKCRKWGMGSGTIQKVFAEYTYPEVAVRKIEENPYDIIKIDGIGFSTADKIGMNMGIKPDSPFRIGAGLLHCLQISAKMEGHCYLPFSVLVKKANTLLFEGQDNKNLVREVLTEILRSRKTKDINNEDGSFSTIIQGDDSDVYSDEVYDSKIYFTEKKLYRNLCKLLIDNCSFDGDIDKAIQLQDKNLEFHLDDSQKEAIRMALSNKVSIITGGPGTGKTTIVKSILDIAAKHGLPDVTLVSPTGRAAKRLNESTGREASTIHRCLELDPRNMHVEEGCIESDIVICDEASMLDLYLASHLMEAIDSKCRIILVGDVHQLPAVGAGNVLRDLIDSKVVPTTFLNTIHRQDANSRISLNAKAINEGDFTKLDLSNRASDFIWSNVEAAKDVDDENPVLDKVMKGVKYFHSKGVDPYDIQILSPIYKGNAGVDIINEKMQEYMIEKGIIDKDSPSLMITYPNGVKKTYHIGDKIMQLKNNSKKDIYNGDQGVVRGVNPRTDRLLIHINGKDKTFKKEEILEMTLAYACTIHKSQGSEFSHVIMPVTSSHYVMLQRNLLYTGVTRAKKFCALIGDERALTLAINNNKPILRNTKLKEMLQNTFGQKDKDEDIGMAM
jgi:exodeoxyribonuclease V alpha subunit